MARVKSILDRGYDTTLSDFLDKIPQFLLQQQQLKDARVERDKDRQFQQTQYENQLEQQRKNNAFRESQANYTKRKGEFDSFVSLIGGMDGGGKYNAYLKLIESNP